MNVDNVKEYGIFIDELPNVTLEYLIDWYIFIIDHYLNNNLEKRCYFNIFTKLLDEKLKRNEI
jgi:hypothetical protein